MSRTYRRKGYEKTQNASWDKQFNSVAGYYTEYEYEWIKEDEEWVKHSLHRKPTKHEFYQKYWGVHGDGRWDYYGPTKFWRKESNRRMRRKNYREIFKWMKNEEHEVMLHTTRDVLDNWFY